MTRALIAEELQRFGGNSLFNLMRGGSARRALQGNPLRRGRSCESSARPRAHCAQIEIAILEAVLEQSLDKMSEKEKADLFAEFGSIYKPGTGRP